MKTNKITTDLTLDLREEVCPFTFARTKLALEKMKPGQILKVTLRGMAIENVPRSVKEEGHSIIHVERDEEFFIFYISKNGGGRDS